MQALHRRLEQGHPRQEEEEMTRPSSEAEAERIAAEAAAKAPVRTKALGITEKKQIEKLINADYDLLIKDLTQYKVELVRQRTVEVNTQFAELDGIAAGLHEEWVAMKERFQTEFGEWKQRCLQAGITVGESRRSYGSGLLDMPRPDYKITGKERALREIEDDVNIVISRAKHALDKKRSEAIRALIMHGGIPEEARALIGSLPDPKETILEAMQQTPRLLALTQGRQAPVVQQEQQPGEDIIGLVVHDQTDFRR
jgi:hypothetical protein